MGRSSLSFGSGLLGLLLASCAADTLTEVFVVVDTDLAVPQRVDEIAIEIDSTAIDGSTDRRTQPLSNRDPLPVTLGVVHHGGPLGPLRVRAVGLHGGVEVLDRRAELDFVQGELLVLRLELLESCIGVACPGDDQTCEDGSCRSTHIEPSELRPHTDAGVQPIPPGCIPTEEQCNGVDDDCDGMTDEGTSVCDQDVDHVDAVACVEAACVPTCSSGYADCDGAVENGCEVDLSDPATCGSCEHDCRLPAAEVDCVEGRCMFTGCREDHWDCDGLADNGCESERLDVENCGECGAICDLPNAISSCGTGLCTFNQCDMGWDNCDARAENGCETSLEQIFDCGSCDRVCTGGDEPHAAAACIERACGVACDPGWADCNGDEADGCETDLSLRDHCGACGNRCTGVANLCSGDAGGGYLCIAPPCEDPFPTRCTDSCVNTESNPSHCGGCDRPCLEPPNASPTCESSGCGYECDEGFGDCDADPINGCETALNALDNCGACGIECSLGGATATCVAGRCAVAGCTPGFGDCNDDDVDGCETPLDTLSNCGFCGHTCSLDHASSSCDMGACRVTTCDAGWADCDGLDSNGCEADLSSDATCGSCDQRCTGLTSLCNGDASAGYSCIPPPCPDGTPTRCGASLDFGGNRAGCPAVREGPPTGLGGLADASAWQDMKGVVRERSRKAA